MLRREKYPRHVLPCLSPDSKSLHRNNLQAQASLGFDKFSQPPLFVPSILEGCSKQTGNVTQKCGSTFVSCFRKMSVSQSRAVELTHSISEESFDQSWSFVLKTTYSPRGHKDKKLFGGMLCALSIYLQGSGYTTDVLNMMFIMAFQALSLVINEDDQFWSRLHFKNLSQWSHAGSQTEYNICT